MVFTSNHDFTSKVRDCKSYTIQVKRLLIRLIKCDWNTKSKRKFLYIYHKSYICQNIDIVLVSFKTQSFLFNYSKPITV